MVAKKKNIEDFEIEELLDHFLWKTPLKLRSPEEVIAHARLNIFMVYCAYVSANRELLEIQNFDEAFGMEHAKDNLGNLYVARDFVQHYCELSSPKVRLPHIDAELLDDPNRKFVLMAWSGTFESVRMVFEDDETYAVARRIAIALSSFDRLVQMAGGSAGEYYSSDSLSKLVVALGDVAGKRVLDFMCGNCSFLAQAELAGAKSVVGHDLNANAVFVGEIVCFFGNPAAHSEIEVADASCVAGDLAGSADRVLVAPPIGATFGKNEADRKKTLDVFRSVAPFSVPEGISQIEDLSVLRALYCLDEGGLAIVQVPQGFLFRKQRDKRSVREVLVEGGYLRAVVSLPGGTLQGTGIKSSLLVMGKESVRQDVLIADIETEGLAAKGVFEKSRSRCRFSPEGVEFIVRMVRDREECKLVSVLVAPDELAAHDYDLCYATYGATVDLDALKKGMRDTSAILDDIEAAQASIADLDIQIKAAVEALENTRK